MQRVRQCRVCLRVHTSDEDGSERWSEASPIPDASHGYCPPCFQAALDRAARELRLAGPSGTSGRWGGGPSHPSAVDRMRVPA